MKVIWRADDERIFYSEGDCFEHEVNCWLEKLCTLNAKIQNFRHYEVHNSVFNYEEWRVKSPRDVLAKGGATSLSRARRLVWAKRLEWKTKMQKDIQTYREMKRDFRRWVRRWRDWRRSMRLVVSREVWGSFFSAKKLGGL